MKCILSKVSREHIAICAVWFSAIASAGCSGFSLPNPPDMSALVTQYTNPDGELNPDTAEEVATQVVDRVNRSQGGAPIALSNELIQSLAKLGNRVPKSTGNGIGAGNGDGTPDDVDTTTDAGAGTQSVLGNKIDVGAVVKVHHICAGWHNRIDEEENGFADLTVTFDQGGLIPTIWGQLTKCRLQRGASQVELDGEVNLHLGTVQPRIGLRALKTISYLIEFNGSASVMRNGQQVSGEGTASFRVFPSGIVQMNVELANGTNVLGVFQQGVLTTTVTSGTMLAAGVQASNATWGCQLAVNGVVGGSCTNEADPSMVVTW
jgi:hypothetical protein